MKLGRNEPCHCGSGLKYKKCCLGSASNISNPQIDLAHAAQETLINQVKEQLGKNVSIAGPEYQETKMSDVILEFGDELFNRAKTASETEIALMVVCMAWNLALFDAKDRIKALTGFLEATSHGDAQAEEDLQEILSDLIQHKLNHYAHIKRWIVNYQLSGTGDDIRLDIASIVHQQE